jgi:hypothetical protein
VARERERLHRAREAVCTAQQELEQKLAAINWEFAAIDAYEAAKSGKAPPPSLPRARAAPRGRRGSKREALELIKANAAWLARKDIIERMGRKGEKPGEMSVSNALTALTKGELRSCRRRGGIGWHRLAVRGSLRAYQQHGLSQEWRAPQTRPADGRARECPHDEALRSAQRLLATWPAPQCSWPVPPRI